MSLTIYERNITADSLGLILVNTNTIKQTTVDEAAKNAKATGMSLDRALIISGEISEYTLKPAIHLDKMVKNGEISLTTAVKALRLARCNNIDIDDAIHMLRLSHKTSEITSLPMNHLCDLLVKAQIISPQQLRLTTDKAQEMGMHIGRMLILNRDLTSSSMMAAISAQMLVRDKKITAEQAIAALKFANSHRTSIEEALFRLGLYMEKSNQPVKLGELFAMAGYLSESDMLECLEIELTQEKQFGQIMFEQGLVIQQLLEAAIVLQGMVTSNELKAYEAAETLKYLRCCDISVYQVVAQFYASAHKNPPMFELCELLCQAGIVKKAQLDNIVKHKETNNIKISKTILHSGLMDEITLYNALRCHSLLKEGYLSNEQAANGLRLCCERNIDLSDALQELGIVVPVRMQWVWT